jgi:ABC-type phosphonate transport system ATPase subunit
MHEKRWRVLSKLDFDEAPGFVVVRVRTPKGTGKTAYGLSLLAAELADNRKWIAHAVRKARTAASTFRAKAERRRYIRHLRAISDDYRARALTLKGEGN